MVSRRCLDCGLNVQKNALGAYKLEMNRATTPNLLSIGSFGKSLKDERPLGAGVGGGR